MERVDVIIVGSGCAGYAAADRLMQFGIRNIALLTEGKNFGTSRNTGSDKQTYYKADLSGTEDSLGAMIRSLYQGGAMDGEQARVEAVNSLRCFFRLQELGMHFPQGDYGEFVGYRTDHDASMRATSVGPFTSQRMVEVLETSVLERGLRVIDGAYVVRVAAAQGRVHGVIYFDRNTRNLAMLASPCVILAVGGSACVYADSVYPASQHGGLSLAIQAGCTLRNMTEWQYGVASVGWRWNMSGSFQQVIPIYISIDAQGTEREFLRDTFPDRAYADEMVFRKGYEWPFDYVKINGSSAVDLAVLAEIAAGRKVYLDYDRNPSGWQGVPQGEAQAFWQEAGFEGGTPWERLCTLNPQAAELVERHSVLSNGHRLQIAVCAQHCNGGVDVDSDYQSAVRGLYVIGEASGNFGVYRPGGSALNSTQVGALRAAQAIVRGELSAQACDETVLQNTLAQVQDILAQANQGQADTVSAIITRMQRLCSNVCGIRRDCAVLPEVLDEIRQARRSLCAHGADAPLRIFRCLDMLDTQEALVRSVLYAAEQFGSRGGAMYTHGDTVYPPRADNKEWIVLTGADSVMHRACRPLPQPQYCFEHRMKGDKVWQ